MSSSHLFLLATVAVLALIDFIPRIFIAKNRVPKVTPSYTRTPKYLILPTVYGDIKYLQNLTFLKQYSDKVIVCTSKYETPEFYHQLRQICNQNGLRYACADLPIVNGKPLKSPYTIYRGLFTSNQLKVPKDTPCILIDADTYSKQNVNNLARAFIASYLDISSLRCEVSNPLTTIEKLQAFEYKLAMDGRNMDPWLTSGACSIAKYHVYKSIFRRHSNFFIGGDIEIGKLAQIMGYKLGHLDFTFLTTAPDTFKSWFKQRILWFAGGFRHHVTNIGSFGWHHFFLLFYNSLLIYLLFPLRWIELINLPQIVPIILIISWLYTFILVGRSSWKPVYLLLPFYSLIQTMVIVPLAFVKYTKLAWQHRSLGLLRHDLSSYSMTERAVFNCLNVASALIIVSAAIALTTHRTDYWIEHGFLTSFVISIVSTIL